MHRVAPWSLTVLRLRAMVRSVWNVKMSLTGRLTKDRNSSVLSSVLSSDRIDRNEDQCLLHSPGPECRQARQGAAAASTNASRVVSVTNSVLRTNEDKIS